MIINIKFSENVSKKRLEVSTVKLLCSSRHISRSRGVCYSVTQQEKAFPLSPTSSSNYDGGCNSSSSSS